MNQHVHVLAPTWLEHVAARAALPHTSVSRVGIGAPGCQLDDESPVIVCGLAGGLAANIQPGEVIVPDRVADEAGNITECDGEMVDALRSGCRHAGFPFTGGTMLTASHIITGAERKHWSALGSMAVDMETAVIAKQVSRVATVRVALDTVSRPISSEWTQTRAALSPHLLRQLIWLAGHAPRYALRAAVVVRYALRDLDS